MTVRAWLTQWHETVRSEVSPKTHERYGEIVNNFLIPALGNLALVKLAPINIQHAYNGWATGGRHDGKPGGLSPRSRRHIHRILKSALSRAVEQQLLARNPAEVFKKRLPKVARRDMNTLTTDESARLLYAIKHTRIYWPVLIALSTGMRRGEVPALRWRNVDFEGAVVRVVESLEQTKTGIRFKSPKTDRTRAVTLPAFCIEELRRLKCQQAEELLMLGVGQTAETLVRARADGEPLQPQSLTHQFTRLITRIEDFPRIRLYDLRHSHATQLLAVGVHPKIVQERLGHASITTTLDLYSHVTSTMQGDAAARLDAAFQPAIKVLKAAK
ncbi:MAG: site-specific integrase [Pseudolabrys sp.]